MSWSSGTELMEEVVLCYQKLHGTEEVEIQKEFYRTLIYILNKHDWDCEYEVHGLDPCLDEVLREEGLLEEDDQ